MFTHGQIDDVRHSNVLCDSFLPRQPLVFPQPLLSLHLVGGGCRGGDGVAAVIAVPPGPVVLMRRVERGRRTGVWRSWRTSVTAVLFWKYLEYIYLIIRNLLNTVNLPMYFSLTKIILWHGLWTMIRFPDIPSSDIKDCSDYNVRVASYLPVLLAILSWTRPISILCKSLYQILFRIFHRHLFGVWKVLNMLILVNTYRKQKN